MSYLALWAILATAGSARTGCKAAQRLLQCDLIELVMANRNVVCSLVRGGQRNADKRCAACFAGWSIPRRPQLAADVMAV